MSHWRQWLAKNGIMIKPVYKVESLKWWLAKKTGWPIQSFWVYIYQFSPIYNIPRPTHCKFTKPPVYSATGCFVHDHVHGHAQAGSICVLCACVWMVCVTYTIPAYMHTWMIQKRWTITPGKVTWPLISHIHTKLLYLPFPHTSH